MERKSGGMYGKIFIIVVFMLIMSIGFCALSYAETSDGSITMTYTSEENSTVYQTTAKYDERFYSLPLIDFGEDTVTKAWTHSKISATVNGETVNYEPAFAGWKLTKINGAVYTGDNYFYPDHDFVYFNDAPFTSYDTITSLEFEALWGKTIYVRDKYNFVNLGKVFGNNINVAAIEWDDGKTLIKNADTGIYEEVDFTYNSETGLYEKEGYTSETATVYADDSWNGANRFTPVETLTQAETLMGANGGKIVIVNHLTLEAVDSGSNKAYAYTQGFNNKAVTTKLEIGNTITNGVLTITGADAGIYQDENGNTIEGKGNDSASYYSNSTIFFKNTRGNGVYGTSTTYTGLGVNLYLHSSTVMESLQLMSYRESYNTNSARATLDAYIYTDIGEHYVFESDLDYYKRVTAAATKGQTTENWLHTKYNDNTAVSAGNNAFHINNGQNYVAGSNIYMTLYGTYQSSSKDDALYSLRINSGANNSNINNVHINADKYYFAYGGVDCMGSTTAVHNYNFIGINFTDVVTPYYSPVYTSSRNITNVNKLTIRLGGVTSNKITAFYVGPYSSASNGNIATLNCDDLNVYVDGGVITNLYGGGNQVATQLNGKVNYHISGGTITGLYGGGLGGFVGTESSLADITMNITGGKITNVYGGGAGGVVSLYASGSPTSIASYTIGFAEDGKTPLYAYVSTNTNSDNRYVINGTSSATYTTTPYMIEEVNGYLAIKYRHLYLQSGTNMTNYANYYMSYGAYTVSDAAVYANIKINIDEKANIVTNVYGGGKNGQVIGNLDINVSGGTIGGDVFGGGEGLNDTFTLQNANIENLKVTFDTLPTSFNAETYAAAAGEGDTKYNKALTLDSYYKPFLTGQEIIDKGYYADGSLHIYSDAILKLGRIAGDANVNITGGTIKGSVYGGSNGVVASITGDANVSVSGEGISIAGNIYGGGNAGDVSGSIDLLVGKTTLKGNVYGGGKVGNVAGSTNVSLHGATAKDVFGGGYSGRVGEDSHVTITEGSYENVFGGCDLAVVSGDTVVIVGDNQNKEISISGVLYGGGRGVDSDNDGDASDFCTVEGQSDVTIKGMNTHVQNYGSTKLGSVNGNVDVTFDTYRKNNSTNPYVTMNGIDRATTVSLINSYIALENKGANGEKEGIKNIVNLSVPAGSGLKVTATGVISGNFYGGGSFYLDSKVSLTVGGNITGNTELVINPQIAEEEDNVETPLVIKGTLVYPYLVVKGNSNSSNIYCTDDRYKSVMQYDIVDNIAYYYLANDIGINEQISQVFVNKEGINYTEDNGEWGNVEKVVVQQDGIFTTNVQMTYNFAVDNNDSESYRNIARGLKVKESSMDGVFKTFPAGTIVTMITDNTYYKYRTTKEQDIIYLADFTEMENTSVYYNEVSDLISDNNTIKQGTTASSVIYTRDESYRFVLDFTYTSEYLPVNSYIIYLDVQDKQVSSSALDLLAENIVDLKHVREYDFDFSIDAERNYIEKDLISVNMNFLITALGDYETNKFIGMPLCARVTIKDENGNLFTMPAQTVFKLNSKAMAVEGGVARINLIDSLSSDESSMSIPIQIDMRNIAEYSLKSGKYTITFESYIKDSYYEKIVGEGSFAIDVVRPDGCAITLNFESDENALKVDSSNKKVLKMNYFGDVYNPYVKVRIQKKNTLNAFEDVDYTLVENMQINNLVENNEKEITLDFSSVPSGIYRVYFDVYGYEKIYSTSVLVFEK